MSITSVFYIKQRLHVVTSGSYMPQQSSSVILHRNVNNTFQIQVFNEQQKPVDLTGKNVIFRMLNSDNTKLLVEKVATVTYALTGIITVSLSKAELENVAPQKCFFSLTLDSEPLFTDMKGTGFGLIEVADSILPKVVFSTSVHIPTQIFPNTIPNTNAIRTYYSDLFYPTGPTTTVAFKMSNFTGNVTIQGASSNDNNWVDVQTSSHTQDTKTYGATVKGFFSALRLSFVSSAGDITHIITR